MKRTGPRDFADFTHDHSASASHGVAVVPKLWPVTYSVEIYLETIGARFTWRLSEHNLCRLRADIHRGDLGPARIKSVEPVEQVPAAA